MAGRQNTQPQPFWSTDHFEAGFKGSRPNNYDPAFLTSLFISLCMLDVRHGLPLFELGGNFRRHASWSTHALDQESLDNMSGVGASRSLVCIQVRPVNLYSDEKGLSASETRN